MKLPDFVEQDSWEGFAEMRKSIKKPLTDRSMRMAFKMLLNLKNQGEDPNLVLNQSEFYLWQGLFKVKPEFYEVMGINRNEQQAKSTVIRMTDRSWADG